VGPLLCLTVVMHTGSRPVLVCAHHKYDEQMQPAISCVNYVSIIVLVVPVVVVVEMLLVVVVERLVLVAVASCCSQDVCYCCSQGCWLLMLMTC
jgi:hypothetical protein